MRVTHCLSLHISLLYLTQVWVRVFVLSMCIFVDMNWNEVPYNELCKLVFLELIWSWWQLIFFLHRYECQKIYDSSSNILIVETYYWYYRHVWSVYLVFNTQQQPIYYQHDSRELRKICHQRIQSRKCT